MPGSYENDVFVNCPFDDAYRPLFRAIVFAVHDCGFVARCALEQNNSGDVRLSKIEAIIRESRLGIHDVSRTELDEGSGLPRFNMPLELGLFLGAQRYGTPKQKRKQCLVMDSEQFRYQAYMSDIAGQDIACHHGQVGKITSGAGRKGKAVKMVGVIPVVRDWLSHQAPDGVILPGGKTMVARYEAFLGDLPAMLEGASIAPEELIYNDYTTFVVGWLLANPWGTPRSR